MGRFFLLMAQERASEQGVRVRTIIRKGNVLEEIINAAHEEAATLVVLGQPAGTQSTFRKSSLQAVANDIENQTGAEVLLI